MNRLFPKAFQNLKKTQPQNVMEKMLMFGVCALPPFRASWPAALVQTVSSRDRAGLTQTRAALAHLLQPDSGRAGAGEAGFVTASCLKQYRCCFCLYVIPFQ